MRQLSARRRRRLTSQSPTVCSLFSLRRQIFCVFMSAQFVVFVHAEENLFAVWESVACVQKKKKWLLWVQSMTSCLIRMRVGGCRLPRPSLRRMYSLNCEESTPPPHEPVIQNPLCCNRSNTCSHTKTTATWKWDSRHFLQRGVEVKSNVCSHYSALSFLDHHLHLVDNYDVTFSPKEEVWLCAPK